MYTQQFVLIQKFLGRYCNLNIVEENYDAILIKKLASTNIIKKDSKSHQSHIAITGNKNFDFFPHIIIHRYVEEEYREQKMKSFYILRLPIVIHKSNIKYVNEENKFDFSDDTIIGKASIKYSRPNSPQLELGNTSQSDKVFVNFRKCFDENDVLILLKRKKELVYDGFIMNKSEFENVKLIEGTYFNLDNRKNSTFVDTSLLIRDKRISSGKNIIYYGAPGTGKSYQVNVDYPNYDRVTFHPEYTYFDFVGGLRPVSDEGKVKYDFVPGPFTNVLLKAMQNPEESFGLIIEEINRANTAAVFGDIFQLLDRDDKGNSKYGIVNKDVMNYLSNNLKDIRISEIIIPSNMSIIATMNSSDQGVQVLDSAFKRRWEFKYMPINFNNENLYNEKIDSLNVYWKDFGEALNMFLSRNGIEEDKLIGQWFLNEKELQDEDLIASKLLIYLWDDVVRYNRKLLFPNIYTFAQLIKEFKRNGLSIFAPELKQEIQNLEKVNLGNQENE